MSLPMRKTSYSQTMMTIFHHPVTEAKQVFARTSTRSSTSVQMRSRRLAYRLVTRVLQCRTMLVTFATLPSASPTKTTHSSCSAIRGQLTSHYHQKLLQNCCRIQTFLTRLISGTISRWWSIRTRTWWVQRCRGTSCSSQIALTTNLATQSIKHSTSWTFPPSEVIMTDLIAARKPRNNYSRVTCACKSGD